MFYIYAKDFTLSLIFLSLFFFLALRTLNMRSAHFISFKRRSHVTTGAELLSGLSGMFIRDHKEHAIHSRRI